MNKTFKLLTAVSALIAPAFLITPARAEQASLHVSGGASEVTHGRSIPAVIDNNEFRTGVNGDVKLLFPLVPNLAVGPTASVFYFTPSANPNSEAAVLWNFGGTARLQGNHTGLVVPYLDGSGYVDKHGSVWNPAMGASAGIDFALDPTHTYFGGVYVSWTHVFQTNTAQERQSEIMNHHDVNTVSAGLSLSFDYPPKTVVVVKTVPSVTTVRLEQPTVTTPTESTPEPQVVQVPVLTPTEERLGKTVQFAKDSAVVDTEAKAFLVQFASKLNTTKGMEYNLTVEGYASSEGGDDHNLILSRQRANAVVDYLVTQKVERTRMTVVSVGAVGDKNDAANRKVEFVVRIAQE